VIYGAATFNVTMLRQAGRSASNMLTLQTQMMNDFVAGGRDFPSDDCSLDTMGYDRGV
jgi:hypothetical protein